jgi:hypothetical protein
MPHLEQSDRNERSEPGPGIPPRKSEDSLHLQVWLAIVIILVALCARLIPGPRTIDDSFITYRYTRNILAGNGFVYNPGERVLGTTTPLYTILLVVLGFFTGGTHAPFPLISLIVNALSDALTCLLLLRLGRKLNSPLAGIGCAFVWAVAPYSVTFAIGGLETSLYVLLLTGTVSAYIDRRYPLAAFLGALSLLTRPDALILLGPMAFDRLISLLAPRREASFARRVRSAVKELAIFLVPVLPWVIFSVAYFGSPLPHSIAAKSLAYNLPGEAAFIRLLQHYATPFLENLTFGTPAIGVGAVLYLFLYFVGARHALQAQKHLWFWLAYPWLYFITFAVANPLIFRWYLTPPLPAYFFAILVGVERILSQIASAPRVKEQPVARLSLITIFVVLLPLGLTLRGWTLHPDHAQSRPAPEMAYIQLELLYRQAADSLAPEMSTYSSPPLLAAGDVGVLGFYTGAHILDTVGLNSPVSTRYYPLDSSLYVINYAIPPDLIVDQQPDYVVILEVYGRAGLLQDPRFQAIYQLRQKIPTDMYGSDGMLIFAKR